MTNTESESASSGDPALATETPPTTPPGGRRRIRNTIIAGVAAVAVIVAGGLVATNVVHAQAVARANTAIGALSKVEISERAAQLQLQDALNDTGTQWAKLTALQAAVPGFVDQTVIDKSKTDTAPVQKTLTGFEKLQSSTDPVAYTVSNTPTKITRIIGKDWDTGRIDKTSDALDAASKKIGLNTIKLGGRTGELVDQAASVRYAYVSLTLDAMGATQGILAAAPSADQPSRDFLAAAITAVQEHKVKLVPGKDWDTYLGQVDAYFAAIKGVQDSHAAVETQKAIDAAAAADSDTYVDPSTGESKPNPNYRGGGSGGGSGGGGGGGSGGGSGGGGGGSGGGSGGGDGGGSTGPVRYPMKVATGGTCSGAGGSQSVTYGSTLVVPGDAISYSTYEIDSYGYGVNWTCDTGW